MDFYPPTPPILQWLANGQLSNRLHRAVRLWRILYLLYSSEKAWAKILPQPFSYSQLRNRLYSLSHPKSDRLSAEEMAKGCKDPSCTCHHSLDRIMREADWGMDEGEWKKELQLLTGFTDEELQRELAECPFNTVHRSLRDDLKHLIAGGWLRAPVNRKYECVAPERLPTPPLQVTANANELAVPANQGWELLRILESISFVQPNLEPMIQQMWDQICRQSGATQAPPPEEKQRIFVHLDYILAPDDQDRVDNYQEQIERLWQRPPGGVIRFKYAVPQTEETLSIITYPVCIHYVRRAKYLSAYGETPQGKIGWHNFRLDRITSDALKVMAWGDPNIPKQLKDLWRCGELPQPEDVQEELARAWGFNFYLPRELMILRFPAKFAHWYVDHTVRHPTFKAIAYSQLPTMIRDQIPDRHQRQQLLKVIMNLSPEDSYYYCWIRNGDVNVTMRLRDWRPHGEVVAPVNLRQQMFEEAAQEVANYQGQEF